MRKWKSRRWRRPRAAEYGHGDARRPDVAVGDLCAACDGNGCPDCRPQHLYKRRDADGCEECAGCPDCLREAPTQEEADNAALAEALKGPMGLVHLFELKVGQATEMIVAADAQDAIAVLAESERDEPASSIRCLDQLEPVTLTLDDGTKRTRPAIEWALINGRGPLGGSEY